MHCIAAVLMIRIGVCSDISFFIVNLLTFQIILYSQCWGIVTLEK